jgi:RNase P protein component
MARKYEDIYLQEYYYKYMQAESAQRCFQNVSREERDCIAETLDFAIYMSTKELKEYLIGIYDSKTGQKLKRVLVKIDKLFKRW